MRENHEVAPAAQMRPHHKSFSHPLNQIGAAAKLARRACHFSPRKIVQLRKAAARNRMALSEVPGHLFAQIVAERGGHRHEMWRLCEETFRCLKHIAEIAWGIYNVGEIFLKALLRRAESVTSRGDVIG